MPRILSDDKTNISITDALNEENSAHKKIPLIPSLKAKIQQASIGGVALGFNS